MPAEPTSPAGKAPEFVDVDMSGAVFREVNLSGSRMRGALLLGADIDGAIDGLVVNGVEVAPSISAELDRLPAGDFQRGMGAPPICRS